MQFSLVLLLCILLLKTWWRKNVNCAYIAYIHAFICYYCWIFLFLFSPRVCVFWLIYARTSRQTCCVLCYNNNNNIGEKTVCKWIDKRESEKGEEKKYINGLCQVLVCLNKFSPLDIYFLFFTWRECVCPLIYLFQGISVLMLRKKLVLLIDKNIFFMEGIKIIPPMMEKMCP